MVTVLLVVAILLLIGIGMRLIHLLNAQHDARIASYQFSDTLPAFRRRSYRHHGRARAKSPDGTGTHPDEV
ncbi:hypothetical protein [Streptomyces melanogenes]|uniref:Secreted protein n=1 Tax=Streptomyces melanogenes TaxID=67326 RepID=A0ABZ1XEP2_9ACTN|nr:hypothetical protein [Streptomyces melanogenes]